MMRRNGVQYYQLPTGELMSIDSILDDIGGTIQTILPPSIHNLHAIRRLPDTCNTDDPAHTCTHCNTSYRDSDQRDPDRCPYCWRLVTDDQTNKDRTRTRSKARANPDNLPASTGPEGIDIANLADTACGK